MSATTIIAIVAVAASALCTLTVWAACRIQSQGDVLPYIHTDKDAS